MKARILFIVCLVGLSFTGLAQDAPVGLNVNDVAPSFSGRDQNGKNIDSKSLLENGPVVLVFYRGQWCPYCNKQLSKMQDSLSFFTSKGATVIAITPEKPENISKTIEKTKASYSVLFDDGLKIMKDYKVSFAIDDAMAAKYKSYGIDFTVVNGSNGANLPVPAIYIISKDGKIIYRHFDPDYRKRPSVKEIAAHL